jgi:4-amino-4-deoxy-L-arabinose transferase-like glycosyltransferase
MTALNRWLDQDLRRAALTAAAALLGLCGLAFFLELGGLGLMDKTEGLFVEVPRQMLLRGDWVTPRWNGSTFFDYPVWGYWMVALSFRLFGISEWAARLPAAAAASVAVLAVFGLVLALAPAAERPSRRVGRASLCAVILALSPGWIGWSRSSVTDMFLASAMTLALLGFALAYWRRDDRRLRRLGHGALAGFCGVAVLAKGPVGLLLPGLVIIAFLALRRRLWDEVRQTPWLPLLALFCGITLPWYVLATQANGFGFISHFIGFSNLERFTSVLYAHPGPPWFYLPWVLLLLLPWSLYLPAAMVRLRFWSLRQWREAPETEALALFALLWLVLIVAFFSSAATKLPGYILPSLPGAALLVGLLFAPLSAAESRLLESEVPWRRLTGWLNATLLALMAIAAVLAPRWIETDPAYPGFAAALASSALPWLLALPLLAAAIALVLLLRRGALPWLWAPNALGFAAVIALVVPGLVPLMDRERLLPIRVLARQAARSAQPGEPLLVAGYKRYSVVFYSGRPVLFVHDPRSALEALDGDGSPTVLVLGSDAELLDFGVGPGDAELLGRSDAHRLIRLPRITLEQLQARP